MTSSLYPLDSVSDRSPAERVENERPSAAEDSSPTKSEDSNRPPKEPRGRPALRVPPALALNLALLGLTVAGAGYYFAPVAERVRSPLHDWLRPSGYLGQSAGILTFLGFLFLWLYPLRKRARWLAWTGSVGRWLDVHIVVGLTMPLMGAIHASWRFTGLIGLGYLAMIIVFLSGVVGKYIYARIPRTKAGVEMSLEEASSVRMGLMMKLATITGLEMTVVESVLATEPVTDRKIRMLTALRQMVADDWARRRAARALVRAWRDLGEDRPPLDRRTLREVLRLARRQMALAQQARLLDATQRIFRFWHVAHKPVGITALLAVTIHVVVVVLFGATWFY